MEEERGRRKNTQPRCSSILQTSKSFASKKIPPKLLRIKTGLGNGGREGEEKHPAPMFLYFTNR
jgi:hypothetical protein